MKNLIFAIFFISVLYVAVQSVNADVQIPGTRGIGIKNIISNINDFPDYIFVSTAKLGEGFNFGMCPIKTIDKDGEVPSYYKFCIVSVYAIKGSEFNQTYVMELSQNISGNAEELQTYFSSLNAKEVIKGISTYTTVPVSSTEESITKYYKIDLETVKENPDTTSTGRNYLFYVYISLSLIALLIIIFLLIRKRR